MNQGDAEAPPIILPAQPPATGTSPENLVVINFPTGKAYVNESRDRLLVGAKELDGGQVTPTVVLHVLVVDNQGSKMTAEANVDRLGAGFIHWYEVNVSAMTAPLIVTANCGCPFSYLFADGGQIWEAPRSLFTTEWANTTVTSKPESLTLDGTKTRFESRFSVPQNIAGYTFVWSSNAQGTVRLITPSGNELAEWEVDGREVIAGHVSNGSRPFEAGDWALTLAGTGTFTLHWEQTTLDVGAFHEYANKTTTTTS